MRQTNKNLSNVEYSGKMDKGGNDQRLIQQRFFKPFANSKNLQTHGTIPVGSNMVGGVGINVSSYSNVGGDRYKHASVANMG